MFTWSSPTISKEYWASSVQRFLRFSLLDRWLLRDLRCLEEPEYVYFPDERLFDFDLTFCLSRRVALPLQAEEGWFTVDILFCCSRFFVQDSFYFLLWRLMLVSICLCDTRFFIFEVIPCCGAACTDKLWCLLPPMIRFEFALLKERLSVFSGGCSTLQPCAMLSQ